MDYTNTIMKHTRFICVILCALALSAGTLQAQNNPYVDNKLVHFGFFLGLDLLSYHIQETDSLTQLSMPGSNGHVFHPRAMSVGPGFQVGFITDLRLSRHLSLRFTPSLHFGERSITYKRFTTDSISLDWGTGKTQNKVSMLTIPISIPLYLKWSAERQKNFRPYVVVGGGVEFECFRDKEKMVLHKPFDAFVSAGFGCDFYFRWFKLSPEIKYQIGFLDAHVPTSDKQKHAWGITESDHFYTDAIKRMTHQKLSIIFNFE